jgi:hypothetical protein
MTDSDSDLVRFSFEDAEAIWEAWAPGGEDLLARGAFERTLRQTIGLEDEGLYFRPGGWVVDLPATLARIGCAAAILSAGFAIAGIADVDREIIIAAASLVSAMDVRPARLTRDDRALIKRLRERSPAEVPLTPKQARRVLSRSMRERITREQVADALERLVVAGLADRTSTKEYVMRAQGSEAWIRISLGRERD